MKGSLSAALCLADMLAFPVPDAAAEIRGCPTYAPSAPEWRILESTARGLKSGLVIGVGLGLAGHVLGFEGLWVLATPVAIAGLVLGFVSGIHGETILYVEPRGATGPRLEDHPGQGLRIGVGGASF